VSALRRHIIIASASLTAFAIAGAVLLSGTYGLTRPAIEKSENEAKARLIAQTLPTGGFDNDLVRAARPLASDPLLGNRRETLFYPATLSGAPVAIVLETSAPDGYSGEIKLLVGILADGRVAGVRVVSHRETPGLGDYVEIAKNPWIRQFEGKSLSAPDADAWKDGGQFDYLAGATITPRAVVKAVRKALEYYAAHEDALLAGAGQETAHAQ
jgi:Na+-translocating ferredoxin:NAD+ oxidoreductase subunit G